MPGSKLYDPRGMEVRIRGVNRTHRDNPSTGLWLRGANAERIASDFSQTAARNSGVLPGQMIAHKIFPIPGTGPGLANPTRHR